MSNELIPKSILVDILKMRANILGNPRCGKTNLAKVVLSEFVKKLPTIQIKVFDTCGVWRYDFLSNFKFQEVNNTTRKVYDGMDNILFDVEFSDSEEIMQFIGNDVKINYDLNRERKKAINGMLNLDDWILYVLEEAQSSLGRYSLSRETGRIWLKMISEGANFGLGYLFIGQRAADISASVIERSTCYFIGKTTGENNTRKLKGITGKKAGENELGIPIYEKAKSLEQGEFIWWNGTSAYNFKCPLFDKLYPNNKPIQIHPKQPRWLKIFGKDL